MNWFDFGYVLKKCRKNNPIIFNDLFSLTFLVVLHKATFPKISMKQHS